MFSYLSNAVRALRILGNVLGYSAFPSIAVFFLVALQCYFFRAFLVAKILAASGLCVFFLYMRIAVLMNELVVFVV